MHRGFERFRPLLIITVLLLAITAGGWLFLGSRQTRLPLATIDAPCHWDPAAFPDDTCRTHCDTPYKSWSVQKDIINGKLNIVCCPTGYLPVQGKYACEKILHN